MPFFIDSTLIFFYFRRYNNNDNKNRPLFYESCQYDASVPHFREWMFFGTDRGGILSSNRGGARSSFLFFEGPPILATEKKNSFSNSRASHWLTTRHEIDIIRFAPAHYNFFFLSLIYSKLSSSPWYKQLCFLALAPSFPVLINRIPSLPRSTCKKCYYSLTLQYH